MDTVTSMGDVRELLSTWAVGNDGIDLYIPAVWTVGDLLGRSNINGPCTGKKSGAKFSGSCVGLTGVATSSAARRMRSATTSRCATSRRTA